MRPTSLGTKPIYFTQWQKRRQVGMSGVVERIFSAGTHVGGLRYLTNRLVGGDSAAVTPPLLPGIGPMISDPVA